MLTANHGAKNLNSDKIMNQPTEPCESNLSPKELFEKELAPISFQELQKFFAKGMIIKVAQHLDMVEVALEIHADNAEKVQQWMDNQELERAHDEHAKVWVKNRSELLAVTVAPWVLVQDININ